MFEWNIAIVSTFEFGHVHVVHVNVYIMAGQPTPP